MSPGELCFLPGWRLRQMLAGRQVSAREVLDAHLGQVAACNPQVNAVVTLCADRARQAARRADDRLARGEPAGPLHGLPVAHKDLVEVAGVRTTYGSLLYRDHVPASDHLIVQRMRAAGAIMIGKTNTPEFGVGSQTHNRVFGATRNPWDPARTCGGSSGGAAVALATGMVALADGSDMGGSLRNPASYCNVVGLRTTPGRVPDLPGGSGLTNLSVLGPMARHAADAALLLSVIAGPDPREPGSRPEPGAAFSPLPPRDFRGTPVAFGRDLGGLPFEPAVLAAHESQRNVLAALGCSVADAEPDLGDADRIFRVLRGWQLAATRGADADRGGEAVAPMVRANVAYGRTVTASDLAAAHAARAALLERAGEFWERYEFLVLPVSQVLPFGVDQPWVTEIAGQPMPDYLTWMASCYLISVLAAPAASVPVAFTPGGLPVGMQIVGRPGDDRGVLQLARAVEEAAGVTGRRPPLAAQAAGASAGGAHSASAE
jgi:amidase